MTLDIQLQNRTIKRSFPNTWNTLSPNQAAHVLAVFYAPHPVKLDAQSIVYFKKLQIFKALAQVTDADLNDWRDQTLQQHTLDGEAVDVAQQIWLTDLAAVLDAATGNFIRENPPTDGIPSFVLVPELTKNPFPWFKMPVNNKGTIQKCFAPHNTDELALSNVNLFELSRIFTQFDDYQAAETPDERNKALNRLIALIYRPAKPDTPKNRYANYEGDIRRSLFEYEHLIVPQAALIQKHLPEKIKLLIAFHIESCRASFPALYPDLFSQRADTEGGGDWIDFILEMADFDMVKKPVVMRENAHEALTLASRLVQKKRRVPPSV